MSKRFLSLVLVFLGGNFAGAVTIRPGETISITCQNGGGGGGGANPSCIADLTDYCYSSTGYSKDQCFRLASDYCPSTAFSGCVSQTTEYCYRNTGMSKSQCFQSSLKTCNGRDDRDGLALNALMEEVRLGAQITAKGGNLLELKGDAAPKE
jgi:hypothetical protein